MDAAPVLGLGCETINADHVTTWENLKTLMNTHINGNVEL